MPLLKIRDFEHEIAYRAALGVKHPRLARLGFDLRGERLIGDVIAVKIFEYTWAVVLGRHHNYFKAQGWAAVVNDKVIYGDTLAKLRAKLVEVAA